ncbi:TPA: hypothetical protein N0F65_009748 [Lagenidium giganteum]|uniref:Uncharacterized protein n=1 Tax=Lagenidium giganteum TaxID=4803 RepID=A0AAV2YKJ8_9STRA|nr:TPA: hypothetical protein N0F65_009748 [Lagenidium giganteum]
MDNNHSSSDAPSCSVGRSRGPRNGTAPQEEQQALVQQPEEHNIFGDGNLNMVMMFLLALHFLAYAMRPPCGC